jgi:hypothetical protein
MTGNFVVKLLKIKDRVKCQNQNILKVTDTERILYLAIRDEVYDDLFTEPIGQLLLNKKQIKLIVFNSDRQKLSQWIN